MPAVVLALLLVGAPGCQIVADYQSFGAGDGAPPSPCSPLPASKLDSKGLATMVLSADTTGTCYWIDQTEVTVTQYSAFLADAGSPPWDKTLCAWKGTATPSDPIDDTSDSCAMIATSDETGPFSANKPIRCVDWCDARAYCVWAGGDLCGGITNGDFVMPFDMSDQWGIACGSVAGLPYVNGTTPEAGVCNVGLATADCESRLGQPQCAPTDVDIMGGEFPSCVSPSGAVDMIGNVAEWVGQCGGGGDAGTLCQKRGGSFADDLATATCFWQPTAAIDTRDRTVGFRCCASLTAAELARAGR